MRYVKYALLLGVSMLAALDAPALLDCQGKDVLGCSQGCHDEVTTCDQDSVKRHSYALEVLAFPAFQDNQTRYELHLRIPPGDRVSAVYGTDKFPLWISAPAGVFNSPYNGSWSASGMNPKFYDIMPEMQDDSYATIGLQTACRSSGIDAAEDPMMVQDPGVPWDGFFTQDGATELRMDTWTGGSWFVMKTAANGLSVDGSVLLAQITTAGSLDGALNVQVFPSTDSIPDVKIRAEFHGAGWFPAPVLIGE
ncbi:MAG: hypothetical protein O3B70_09710 [Bacteroidetes bacterium]|nr:hypothetical protein [Bacteroidota bacterium]MDA0904597.1 hypothetical protein [Bacteroidota bacterium]MDA1243291.1 hypothetical protein [Bacteroidota bacterium]